MILQSRIVRRRDRKSNPSYVGKGGAEKTRLTSREGGYIAIVTTSTTVTKISNKLPPYTPQQGREYQKSPKFNHVFEEKYARTFEKLANKERKETKEEEGRIEVPNTVQISRTEMRLTYI